MISKGYETAMFDSPVDDGSLPIDPTLSESGDGGKRELTPEFHYLNDLRHAAKVVMKVVASRDDLFSVVTWKGPRGSMRIIKATYLGQMLIGLRNVTEEGMKTYFPVHGFNPYLNLLWTVRKTLPPEVTDGDAVAEFSGTTAVEQVGALLNDYVQALRKGANEPEFKKMMDGFRRACDKNTRSVRRYIDAVFQHRGARHLVIRLELAYAMEDSWVTGVPTSITLKQAKRDLGRFERYIRDHYAGTGFIATMEYGLLRGYHFHTLIFLNGHVHQRDISIGNLLREQWHVITGGLGRSSNCNMNTYRERGVGMINYDDGLKRAALINRVAAYLTKTDFWVRFHPGGKTLFRGRMPKPGPKVGRPREG